jgi:hypothetical protein
MPQPRSQIRVIEIPPQDAHSNLVFFPSSDSQIHARNVPEMVTEIGKADVPQQVGNWENRTLLTMFNYSDIYKKTTT